MSSALAIVGAALAVLGSLMLLAAAFRTSTGWGLSSLFIPGAIVFFVFTNWQEAKRGFFILLVASALIFGAAVAKRQEDSALAPDQPSQATDRARGASESPAAAPLQAPPPASAESSSPPSPTIHWMGQAQGASDAQRQGGSAEHSDAAATEQP